MPELDDLLRSDIADAAAGTVQPPEFAAVLARGRRRRARRRAMTAAACALVVAAAVGGTTLARDPAQAPMPATPKPSVHRTIEPPRPAHSDPAAVVDSPAATVAGLAVAAADPETRAVLWQICERRCAQRRAAIALTTDGFDSRVLVPVRAGAYPYLIAAGDASFVVTNDGRRPYLLDADGTKRSLPIPAAAAPVRDGEVLTRVGDRFVAVDPDAGTVHEVPVPAGTRELQADGPGRLEALLDGHAGQVQRLAWSDDGGASWRDHALAADRAPSWLVPSADPDTAAVLTGADGATLFPFLAAQRGSRDGATWRSYPQDTQPTGYVDGAAVAADGRLLVDLCTFSDARNGHPGKKMPGLYVTDGDDWSTLHRLAPDPAKSPQLGTGEAARLASTPMSVAGLAVGAGHATFFLTEGMGGAGGSGHIYAVLDGGTAWTPLRVR